MDAAIRFEADGFDVSKPQLLGRHVAGAGFLRAAVAGRMGEEIFGYGPDPKVAGIFARMVGAIDPGAAPRWIGSSQLDALSARGVCYVPHPALGQEARLRLRVGPASYSLCGVTHTTATSRMMDALVGLLNEPVMPWDAVICTSTAVAETVRRCHEAQSDYLKWRFGASIETSGPQLPVIPLGVHCADFEVSDAERAIARAELGIADDEIVVLFVGRLVIAAKAHPFQMYQGVQAARARTGRPLTLVQCGWAENEVIDRGFRDGAKTYCPDVRAEFVDGREPAARRRCWAAADIFISLSDSVQETFGLTPIEAMAAGLPCVVSDWDGYKDTVRDGVDGFRIRTWMPAAGAGEAVARAYEAGEFGYARYGWSAVASTSVDMAMLTDRLASLVSDAELRRRMGEAGRRRAREVYAWSDIFRQYQEFWAELNARRLAVADNPTELAHMAAAPKCSAAALDPFFSFEHYPSDTIGPRTVVALREGASMVDYARLKADNLFVSMIDQPKTVAAMFAVLGRGPAAVRDLATASACPPALAVRTVGILAKLGLVVLG